LEEISYFPWKSSCQSQNRSLEHQNRNAQVEAKLVEVNHKVDAVVGEVVRGAEVGLLLVVEAAVAVGGSLGVVVEGLLPVGEEACLEAVSGADVASSL
jgi:hypothetical protein